MQSTVGVRSVAPVDPLLLHQTLDWLTSDMPPAGIKIGMLATSANVKTLSVFLESFGDRIPIVLDPVLTSSSGTALFTSGDLGSLHQLLDRISWITPNWAELAVLTNLPVNSVAEAEAALQALPAHLHAVATGGDASTPIDILRQPDGGLQRFTGTHIATTSTHGTGCAFSSALLSRLILGDAPTAAVTAAKSFVEGALRRAPGLGSGRGPLNLRWNQSQK